MASVEHYFGEKAGIVWKTLHESGPLSMTHIKKKTKLTDRELYGALGWLAREGKLLIEGEVPLLFKFSVKE